ncbi:MAG: SAF domain-containing protein [Acidimicrobiales bacterium]
MTAPATTTIPRSQPDGRGRMPHRLTGGARPGRAPWTALAVLLVVGGALAALLIALNLEQRTAVLAATRDINPGERIGGGDVRVVDVAVPEDVTVVADIDRDRVVGRVASSPIPAGTLLHLGAVSDGPSVAEGEVVVGALLGPGELPVPALRPGDRVGLVEVTDGSARELGVATVYGAADGPQPGSQLVSLTVAEGEANQVSTAAAGQRLRLHLLAGE